MEEQTQSRSRPWPRSYCLAVVLVLSVILGALSYVPFVVASALYPANSVVSSTGYLNRSPLGDLMQVLYGLVALEVGYIIGRHVAFQTDGSLVVVCAYFGAVAGYVIGLPGMETTSISGGIFLYETNYLNPAHLQSAVFNSATIMGTLVAGIAPASVYEAGSPAAPRDSDGRTSGRWLAAVFGIASVLGFVAYLLPPAFLWLFNAAAGQLRSSSGLLYSFQTNSVVIANPLLMFVVLYLVGRHIKAFQDEAKILALLFAALLAGSLLGNPSGNYLTLWISTGTGAFPAYLANATSLETLLASALDVAFAGTLTGYAAVCLSAVRKRQRHESRISATPTDDLSSAPLPRKER